MRKRMMCIALAALTACMCLSGCGASSDSKTAERKEGQVVNIYSWNTEFKGIYEAYAKLVSDEEKGKTIPTVTDDAMVLSYVSEHKVKMVETDYRNIKITTPEDFGIAETFLRILKNRC